MRMTDVLCHGARAIGLLLTMSARVSLFGGHIRVALAAVVSAGWLAGVTPATAQEDGQTSAPKATFERCHAIKADAARLHCSKSSDASFASSHQPDVIGGWHLLRTPNPTGGRPAVSVMQGADIAHSDPDLAGLMLRCGKDATEVLVVLAHYLPPAAHPKVKVVAGKQNTELVGSVVPPGLSVLLPAQATTLTATSWQAARELAVTITDGEGTIRGVIPLAGLSGALQMLRSNCATQ